VRHELRSSFSRDGSFDAFEALLADEHVTYVREGESLRSTSTPLPTFGFDRRWYSRNNCVGVNPFAFVSEVRVAPHADGENLTRLDVAVIETRAWFFAALAVVAIVAVSFAAPLDFSGRVALALLVALLASFLLLYPAKVLVRKEIDAALRRGVGARYSAGTGEGNLP